jgi:hypothetical protein
MRTLAENAVVSLLQHAAAGSNEGIALGQPSRIGLRPLFTDLTDE